MNTITQEQINNYVPAKLFDGKLWNAELLAPRAAAYFNEDQDGYNFGELAWKEMHATMNWRPRELTIWAAESGIGKSLIQGFQMMHLALHKKRCAIASFEMPVEDTFERQCAAFHGKNFLTSPQEKVEFAALVKNTLFYYDYMGYIKPDEVYRFVQFCAMEVKCKHICIDSLMMIDLKGQNKYEQQKDFVANLKTIANSYDTHVHLVAHHKKPEHEKLSSRAKYSISGASELVNIADNIILIDEADSEEENIVTFRIAKQRRSRNKNKIPYGLKILECGQVVRTGQMKMLKDDLARGCYL